MGPAGPAVRKLELPGPEMHPRSAFVGAVVEGTLRAVAFWNVNGVRKRIQDGSLRRYFQATADCVLVGIVEVKAPIEVLNECAGWRSLLEEFGFRAVAAHASADSCELKGVHGVLWLSRTPLRRVMMGMDMCPEWNDEGRFVAAETPWFVAVLAYVPCTDGSAERESRRDGFNKAFRKQMRRIKRNAGRQGKTVVVCGDLNVTGCDEDVGLGNTGVTNYTGVGASEVDREILGDLREMGLEDAYVQRNGPGYHTDGRHFTWEGQDTRWLRANGVPEKQRLDYFWVPREAVVATCEVLPDRWKSDHYPMRMSLAATTSHDDTLPTCRADASQVTALRSCVIPPGAHATRTTVTMAGLAAAIQRIECQIQETRTAAQVAEIRRNLLQADIRSLELAPCPEVVLRSTSKEGFQALLDTGARITLASEIVRKRCFAGAGMEACKVPS